MEQNRPDRNVHPSKYLIDDISSNVKTNESSHASDTTSNDILEENKLKVYTALPTVPKSPSENNKDLYRYDPKTTPQYKKYSFKFVDSDFVDNEMINNNSSLFQDHSKMAKEEIQVVYGEKVRQNNEQLKTRHQPHDFQ